MEFTYSIVIPHYKIPDLLVKCLMSIPKRNDIQIIVVDDHSPDGDLYLDRYPELRREGLVYIHAPRNGGIGYARNIGIKYAEGKWLLFCDADDTFSPEAFSIMDSFVGTDAKIVFFRPRIEYYGNSGRVSPYSWLTRMYDKFKLNGDERYIRSYHVVAWSKMFNREWLDETGLSFEESRYSEDVIFSIKTGIKADRVIVSDDVIYNYIVREGSHSDFSKKDTLRLVERAKVGMRANRILRDEYSLGYSDGFVAMSALLKFDKKSFFKLFINSSQYGASRMMIIKQLLNRFISKWK